MKIVSDLVVKFSKDYEPSYRAKDGETLVFRTVDCFGGQVKSDADYPVDMDEETEDQATGLVYVENAMPGDILVVDILDVVVDTQGVTCAIGGPLYDKCVPRTKIIPVKNGVAYFNDLKWPVDPMIGVIGVAPAGDPIACVQIGDHGGNMDSKIIKKGARVYLPVQVEGGLLGMGDIHATMGDSELCGTGIEIAGDITVRVSVLKNFKLNLPVTETRDRWYVNCARADYETALHDICIEMHRLLMNSYGWDATDAYLYMSIQCDIEINQFSLPCPIDMSLRAGVPKVFGKELVK